MSVHRYVLAFIASSFLLAWCVQASAQSTTSASAPTEGLAEIVVTAQRRAERLQDVPISISAYDAKTIETASIDSTIALQNLTPGLVLNKSIGAAVPWLRGVGSISSGFGTEMPVATYIDGYYMSTPAAGIFSLANVERVEVLKGPQGTLFGRNASAGVIQVVTRDPNPAGHLDVAVGYGNYDTWNGNIYGTGTLADDLTFSVALTGTTQGDGWGKNVFTGKDVFATDDYNGQLKLQYLHAGTRITLEEIYDNYTSDVGIKYGIIPGELGPDGTPFLGRYDVSARWDPFGHQKQSLTGLKIQQETPVGTVVSLTSYSKIQSLFSLDQNGIPGQPAPGRSAVNIYLNGSADTVTQELQLLSPSGAPIQWISGLYYLYNTQALDQIVHGTCIGLVCGPPPPVLVKARQTQSAYAAYGQATFDVLPRTQLTLGLRYSKDEKSVGDGTAAPAPGFPNTPATLPPTSLARPGLPFAGLPGGIPTSDDWGKLTWRGSLDYKITADVMSYVSVNRGFKSGTYNITSFSNPPAAPEVLDAYELGLKSTWLQRKLLLNAAFFYYDYKDIQLRTTSSAAPGQTVLFNAANSTIKGLDLDLTYAPTSQLSIVAAIETLDAHYDKFPGGTCTTYGVNTGVIPNVGVISSAPCNRGGATMIRAPRFSGNVGVTYTWPTALGAVALNVADSYKASFFWDPSNRVKQNAYHYMTSSLTWTSPNARYDIQLWGRNLNNAFFYTAAFEASSGSDLYSPGEPRTYGVNVRMHL